MVGEIGVTVASTLVLQLPLLAFLVEGLEAGQAKDEEVSDAAEEPEDSALER